MAFEIYVPPKGYVTEYKYLYQQFNMLHHMPICLQAHQTFHGLLFSNHALDGVNCVSSKIPKGKMKPLS